MIELAICLAALVALLTVHERLVRGRELDRLHAAHQAERDQWTRERQLLLNRIKPETAQNILDPNTAPVVPHVRWDDDEDYWSTQDMSKEQLAEMLMAQETGNGQPG